MKCPNCGRMCDDSARFCQACGRALAVTYSMPFQSTSQQVSAKKKTDWSVLVIILVVVIAVVLIAFVAFISFDGGSLLVPKSGTLQVTIENDDFLSGKNYDLYLDDVLKVNDRHIGALGMDIWTFTHTWNGAESSTVKISLHDSDDRWQSDYVSISAGGIAYTTLTI